MELTFYSFGISKIRESEPLKALTVHKLRAFNSTVHLELIELTSLRLNKWLAHLRLLVC